MSNLNIEDAESSFLKGKADFYKWRDDFLNRWYGPQATDMLGIMLNTMPQASRMIDPDAVATMERIYRKMRGG